MRELKSNNERVCISGWAQMKSGETSGKSRKGLNTDNPCYSSDIVNGGGGGTGYGRHDTGVPA